MDSLITAAARALAAGDLLGVLNRVALRDDAHALALRGIAMAQLGDFGRAKTLLRSAAHAFGQRQAWRGRAASSPRPRSRSSRGISAGHETLEAARSTLEAPWGSRQCSACAQSRGPAPASHRPPGRGRRALAELDSGMTLPRRRGRPANSSSPASHTAPAGEPRRVALAEPNAPRAKPISRH